MKTVCKKLLCLMLVAMLLVSAVPAAFADGTTCEHTNMVDFPEGPSYKDPTCTEDGVMPQECADCHNYWNAKAIAKTGHDFDEFPGNAPTCIADGDKIVECKTCKLRTRQTVYSTGTEHNYEDGKCTHCQADDPDYEPPVVDPCANGHDLGDWEQTKAPTTTAKGEKKRVCERTGCDYFETRDIDKLEEEEPDTYILTFLYLDEDGTRVGVEKEIEDGAKISLPTIPLVNGKDFLYWRDSDGNQITKNTVWNKGEDQTITAVYENDTTEDGLVNLTVYANYYVEGEFHHREKLYVEYFEETNKNTMYEWLYSDAGKKQTRDALEEAGYYGYDWPQVKYYNYYGDGEITKASMKTDGNKTVYIKLYSTDEIEASVMLYVHTKETSTVDRVIPMPGYTAGDYVTYDDVKAAVKTKYSGSKMTISDLYSQSEWEDLLDDLDSSGAKSIKVEDNGTTKIHVIVKNASSSKADPSNPKTGDNIMIAVTTMGLAAAALVSIMELKKRKMI